LLFKELEALALVSQQSKLLAFLFSHNVDVYRSMFFLRFAVHRRKIRKSVFRWFRFTRFKFVKKKKKSFFKRKKYLFFLSSQKEKKEFFFKKTKKGKFLAFNKDKYKKFFFPNKKKKNTKKN